jgi:hypothetical protein
MLDLNVDLNVDRQLLTCYEMFQLHFFKSSQHFFSLLRRRRTWYSSKHSIRSMRSSSIRTYLSYLPNRTYLFPIVLFSSTRNTNYPIRACSSVSVLVQRRGRQAGQTEDALAIATFIDVERIVPFYLPVRVCVPVCKLLVCAAVRGRTSAHKRAINALIRIHIC